MQLILLLQTVIKDTITVTAWVLPAVYGSLIAALIAAGASFYATLTSAETARAAANLASQTARELKDKDYKNEFYKKILDKRLQAWENAQSLMNTLGTSTGYLDREEIPYYFSNSKLFDELIAKMDSMDMEAIWIGLAYSDHMVVYFNKLVSIREEVRLLEEGGADLSNSEELIQGLGEKYNAELNVMWKQSMSFLGQGITQLDKVEKLMEDLAQLGMRE